MSIISKTLKDTEMKIGIIASTLVSLMKYIERNTKKIFIINTSEKFSKTNWRQLGKYVGFFKFPSILKIRTDIQHLSRVFQQIASSLNCLFPIVVTFKVILKREI